MNGIARRSPCTWRTNWTTGPRRSCGANWTNCWDGTIRRLVLDLRGLNFMDSSGIGLIIGRYKMMARRGGSVAVVNADRRMDRIFEMAGLYELVERMA